ncbi:hypothetical protein CK222_26175 [Mesorhizobium sp. WSM3866]|nr:hypothetical protein CK214_24600 [Mesorhizobium sp. WSM3882]PBB40851.1 hypothetical protein CK222_26175 [Mesorhizobium sp. WSM3866]PBB80043.1 hypothetical protein CK218_15435 [Mesorhizobium sp. WSM3879]PBB89972.1 hypothetical protein CK215_24785 [Mesorhizobium sp. WSM3864]
MQSGYDKALVANTGWQHAKWVEEAGVCLPISPAQIVLSIGGAGPGEHNSLVADALAAAGWARRS